jgi:protein-S-isoprenylcysteine O-methyltransferase Ste14
MTLLKTMLFTLIVPGTVTVLIPRWLLASFPPWPLPLGIFSFAGLLLLLLGAAIYLWCAWDFTFSGKGTPAAFDPPKELVVKGLYRYVRNPMYLGILAVLLGEACWFAAGRLLVYALIVAVSFHLFVTLYEEPHLRKKFGATYRNYCAAVPRWFPRPPARQTS